MYTKLEDWKNGWFGVELGVTPDEVDALIARLRMLKADPDEHFHLTSDFKGGGGVGDLTICVQAPGEADNMTLGGRALAPGEDVP